MLWVRAQVGLMQRQAQTAKQLPDSDSPRYASAHMAVDTADVWRIGDVCEYYSQRGRPRAHAQCCLLPLSHMQSDGDMLWHLTFKRLATIHHVKHCGHRHDVFYQTCRVQRKVFSSLAKHDYRAVKFLVPSCWCVVVVVFTVVVAVAVIVVVPTRRFSPGCGSQPSSRRSVRRGR
jgi:hypothetical protein